MRNIMIDLETLSTSSNAAIVSIGAVEFDEILGITNTFYVNIDIQSCLNKGLEVSGSTIKWWMKQDKEAKRALFTDPVSLKEALIEFKTWIVAGPKNIQVWGNGAAFDNVVLKNAYSKFNSEAPWHYTADRCYRTMKCSFPNFDMDTTDGVAHNALDDARWQAEYLLKLVEKNNLSRVL